MLPLKSIVTITLVSSASSTSLGAGTVAPNIQIKQPNAYGPGNHMDQYGRSVQITPKSGADSVAPNSQIKKPNAYGPGIHMDQYGRPVQIVPNY